MKKFVTILLMFVMILELNACGTSSEKEEITNVAKYEDCVLTLEDATIETTDTGEKVIKVGATYTNNRSEPLYAYCSFAVRAFQGDVEIDEVSDINGNEASLIREIKNGETINVSYVFKLKDDSKVEVLIGEPTADQITIGRKEYFGE